MSKKDGYSRPGLFGSINHYDSKGHKIGESRPGFFGGYNGYDAKGLAKNSMILQSILENQ